MGCPALQAGRSGASSADWARRLAATAGSLKGTLPPTTPYHRALTMINLTSKGGGCQTGRGARYFQYKLALGFAVQRSSISPGEHSSRPRLSLYAFVRRPSRFNHARRSEMQPLIPVHRAALAHHMTTRRQPLPAQGQPIATAQLRIRQDSASP